MSAPRYRTRTTSNLGSGYLRYRWQGDGYASLREIGSWPSLREYSSIVDAVGTSKTQRVKPVSHYSYKYTGLPYQPFAADYGLMVVPEGEGSNLPQIAIGDFGADEFLLPTTQIVQANGEAFTFFSERFPTKISGAEFVQGIFEIAALLPKLERSVTQTISGAYLTKKFGWDNLLSDLNAFTTLCSSIRERMEFLKRTYGRPTKLHFRKPDLQMLESLHLDYGAVRGFGTRLTLKKYQCDYSATATLLQYLGHIDDFIGWLRAIVISLGLNNPLMSVWKTSRLSFVIDWFFNVSGHLARLAAVQPAEEWSVLDVSHSTKLEAVFDVHQVNDGLISQPDNLVYLGTFTVKRYLRDVGLPLDLTVFTPSSCTPDQLVLLLAMMGAK